MSDTDTADHAQAALDLLTKMATKNSKCTEIIITHGINIWPEALGVIARELLDEIGVHIPKRREHWQMAGSICTCTYCQPCDQHAGNPPTAGHIISWDWQEQPDLADLAEAVRRVSAGTVHITEVDTGLGEYTIVVQAAPVTTPPTRAEAPQSAQEPQ